LFSATQAPHANVSAINFTTIDLKLVHGTKIHDLRKTASGQRSRRCPQSKNRGNTANRHPKFKSTPNKIHPNPCYKKPINSAFALNRTAVMCGRKAGTCMKSPAFARAAYSPLAPQRTSQMPDRTWLSSAALHDDGCQYELPVTRNNPPHNADWMPSCGATAARRMEPGVCAVPGSKLGRANNANWGNI